MVKSIWLLLAFLLVVPSPAQRIRGHESFTVSAVGATPWVSGTLAGGQLASGWTWTVAPGTTPPATCVAKVEVCGEEDSALCTGNAVLDATGIVMADCTTKQGVICADGTCAFHWVRANFTTFTGASATLKTTLSGW